MLFLESASHKKRKRRAVKRIKQIYKLFEKKKKRHLVPKVVIDLPFEGSQKYRKQRVPKAGSKREETITEMIDSCIGEFHTIVVGK